MRLALLLVLASTTSAVAAPPTGPIKLPCTSQFQSIAPDGTHAAIACGAEIVTIELPSGKKVGSFTATQVLTAAISDDASTFAVAPTGKVEVHRVRDHKLIATVDTKAKYTLALALSTDAKLLLVAPLDKSPEVWSVASTPKKLATLTTEFGTATAAAFNRDGTRLAVSTDDLAVRVYDTSTWKSVAEKTDQSVSTLSLAWSNDGKTLALGIAGGVIMLADPLLKVTKTFPARGDLVSDLAFVGDKLFARHRVQGKPSELVLWSADGKPTAITDKRKITGRGVVGDALWLASGTGDSLEIWAP